jgi:hypothetical protein
MAKSQKCPNPVRSFHSEIEVVTGVGGYWFDFGPFDHQKGLDGFCTLRGISPSL